MRAWVIVLGCAVRKADGFGWFLVLKNGRVAIITRGRFAGKKVGYFIVPDFSRMNGNAD